MAAEDWVSEGQAAPAGDSGWGDTINDFGRSVTNAATFGMGNRAKAYIEYLKGNAPSYSEGVDQQAKASDVARERSPYASIAGDVYGSFAVPGLGAEALAARMGGRALVRAGAYGTTGAVTGAAQGAGNTYTGEAGDYAKNALIGGVLGGVLGGAGGAAFGRGPATSRAAVPREAELYAAKETGYDALARSGARYEPEALARRADDLERQLYAQRFNPKYSGDTWQALSEMRGQGAPGQLATGPSAIIDPANIDFIRKGLNAIPKTPLTGTDRASAHIVRSALDDFIVNPPPGAVLPGTEAAARQASTLANSARGDYGAYKRVQKMNELVNNARDTAGANYSGLNLQNELRKGVRGFIREKDGMSAATKKGFNADEIAALRNYDRGTIGSNVLRYAGNALGGGGGAVGIAAGGLVGGTAGKFFKDDPEAGTALGIAAPIVGLGLRAIGNRRANAEISQLRDMIARRSPLYNYRASMSGMQPGAGSPGTAKAARDAVTLELLKQAGPKRLEIDTSDWQ